jgi:hypothetical protein
LWEWLLVTPGHRGRSQGRDLQRPVSCLVAMQQYSHAARPILRVRVLILVKRITHGRPRDVRRTSKRTIQDSQEADVSRRDSWLTGGLLTDNPVEVSRMSVGHDLDNDENCRDNDHSVQFYNNDIPGTSSEYLVDCRAS